MTMEVVLDKVGEEIKLALVITYLRENNKKMFLIIITINNIRKVKVAEVVIPRQEQVVPEVQIKLLTKEEIINNLNTITINIWEGVAQVI